MHIYFTKQQIGLHEISDIDEMKIMTYMRDLIVKQGTINVTEREEEKKWGKLISLPIIMLCGGH